MKNYYVIEIVLYIDSIMFNKIIVKIETKYSVSILYLLPFLTAFVLVRKLDTIVVTFSSVLKENY